MKIKQTVATMLEIDPNDVPPELLARIYRTEDLAKKKHVSFASNDTTYLLIAQIIEQYCREEG